MQKMPAPIETGLRHGALKEVFKPYVQRICLYTCIHVYMNTKYYSYYCVRYRLGPRSGLGH